MLFKIVNELADLVRLNPLSLVQQICVARPLENSTMTIPILEVALHTYKEILKLKLNLIGLPYDLDSTMFTNVQTMKLFNGIGMDKKELPM